jgi:hypothetical protein
MSSTAFLVTALVEGNRITCPGVWTDPWSHCWTYQIGLPLFFRDRFRRWLHVGSLFRAVTVSWLAQASLLARFNSKQNCVILCFGKLLDRNPVHHDLVRVSRSIPFHLGRKHILCRAAVLNSWYSRKKKTRHITWNSACFVVSATRSHELNFDTGLNCSSDQYQD